MDGCFFEHGFEGDVRGGHGDAGVGVGVEELGESRDDHSGRNNIEP